MLCGDILIECLKSAPYGYAIENLSNHTFWKSHMAYASIQRAISRKFLHFISQKKKKIFYDMTAALQFSMEETDGRFTAQFMMIYSEQYRKGLQDC